MILAKAAGAVTIITSSSDAKLKYTKEKYGPDYTINYQTNLDWENKVLEITNGEGVGFIIENGGNGTIAKSIACIKYGGQISLVGLLAILNKMCMQLMPIFKARLTLERLLLK